MKIKDLNQHCGDCGILEYCGTPFGFCVCTDERFGDLDEAEYKKIVETATDIKILDACQGCSRPECGAYRYSDNDYADEPCEHDDEARDYFCEQIADYVERSLLKSYLKESRE